MALNYVVSAQKPTIVTGAVVGNFTAPNDLNLVIAKTNRLEILLVTAEGLKPTQEVPIFGRIAAIKFFRPRGENTDSLLILTAKYHLAVLSWSESGEIVTRAHGNLADRIGRQSETGIIAIVDEPSGLIALRLYDGLLKVVQWEDGRELKAFNLRFEDLNIVDVQFLHNCDKPTIAYIYQDQNGRHLKTALVSVDEKELVMGPWKQDNIESEATMLIPIPAPFGGCVLIGQESISYHKDENVYTAVAPPLIHQSTITCFGKIDKTGQRFLLGDMAGRLFMLLLDTVEGMDGMASVKDLKVELLGETTIAECLVYLDNGVVFVGSRLGDSQLIRLTTEPVDIETNSFVQVLDSYTNLGPILDMALVRLEGQSQVVTCSGAFKEGSLRVVRNGIGIEEHASVDLPGVKGLFAFQKDSQDGFDNYLLVSFVGETRVLMLAGDELEETEIPGIVSDEQTLWAGSLSSPERLVQVTPAGVRMVTGENTVLWSPPESKRISLMSANALTGQLTIACGRDLFYLELTDAVTQIAHVQTDHEIACVDISPIGETNRSEVVAVGLWTDISVRLLSLPDLVEIHAQPLGGEILPRSVLMTRLESSLYLLVALGDGTLFYYQMDTQTGALLERKKVTLGTQPTTLKKFKSRGTTNVFACSDRPTVIYSSNQKLVFSNVNLKLVAHMCPLNAAAYRDSLVMSDGQTLVIGTVDEIQKLHIRTVPLGESPRRIAHQPQTQTLAVTCSRFETLSADGTRVCRPSASKMAPFTSQSAPASARPAPVSGDGEELEVHSLLILDQNTFEVVHAHQLGPNEQATSLQSCKLGDDPTPYYVVGTALVYADESESKSGRLLVFQCLTGQDTGKLTLVHEKEIKGCPFALDVMNGKLLAAINSSVRLFEWTPEKELRLECSHFNFITALYLKTKGDFVLAGDIMRSVCLLAYKSVESTFEEIARDYNPNWMTSVEIIDDDTFLGAENSFNMYTVQKDSAATTDEDRMRLQGVGAYHLGEMVNVFRRGSLVMNHVTGESGPPVHTPILYGSVEGGLGLIAQLPEDYYKFVHDLEARIAKSTTNALRVEHTVYRSFTTEKRTEPVNGFVDGDLVETLLDLPRDLVGQIVQGIHLPAGAVENTSSREGGTVDQVIKLVEDLARIH